jgi:hypothetical protein
MDPALIGLIRKNTPPINTDIINGLAMREMKHVEAYVDDSVRYAERDFPTGLKYLGYKRLTPQEQYLKITELRNSKSQFDVARNDVYMIALNFEFKGEKIVKPLYLPFVRDGGIIMLRGSTFSISPVLVDKGISLGSDSAFVQIPRARITFKRLRHYFLASNERRSPNVVYSRLHNLSKKQTPEVVKSDVTMETGLVHYLFCKYGIIDTFKRYNHTEVHIGTEEEITPALYPETDWVICQSIQRKPRGLKSKTYEVNTTRLALRTCDWEPITEAMIAGFFYLVDHFPNRIIPEYLDGSTHELRLWRVLLGIIIGGINGGEGSINEAMDEHMDSLDSYIDAGAQASLAQGDIFVDDLYGLLYHVLEILSQMAVQSSEALSSMYGKQLMVLRYILRDVNESIVRMLFKLKKSAFKKELIYKDVVKIINKQLPTDIVLKMNDGGKHGEVTSVSSPGDNKFFKITNNMILQTDSGRKRRSSSSGKMDKSKFLHVSIAEIGSYGVLPKSEPTGHTRINPWVQLDHDGSVLRNPKHLALTADVQLRISRDD